ncbi:hypothetical protein LZ31DRAFT_555901 [Colletotrichum somersetense]|nr:hypothetical protein LZ31DRAFT_555901 [Colletotrichum somersetense]
MLQFLLFSGFVFPFPLFFCSTPFEPGTQALAFFIHGERPMSQNLKCLCLSPASGRSPSRILLALAPPGSCLFACSVNEADSRILRLLRPSQAAFWTGPASQGWCAWCKRNGNG